MNKSFKLTLSVRDLPNQSCQLWSVMCLAKPNSAASGRLGQRACTARGLTGDQYVSAAPWAHMTAYHRIEFFLVEASSLQKQVQILFDRRS